MVNEYSPNNRKLDLMESAETQTVIHWFKQDLRLSDNPSLVHAAKLGTVLPIFILDDINSGQHKRGAASRWWLHHSLEDLNKNLDYRLQVFVGNPQDIITGLVKKLGVETVCWNRCYEPWRVQRDKCIKSSLIKSGINVETFNGSLLWEPWEVKKNDQTPYKVFTPFFRNGCRTAAPPRQPLPPPDTMELVSEDFGSLPVRQLNLVPEIRWDKKLEPHWKIGELHAQRKLANFKKEGLTNYKIGRDFPAKPHVSRLSPHLHFGEISPNQVWYSMKCVDNNTDVDRFLTELGWREFSYNMLFNYPELPDSNFRKKFDDFSWDSSPGFLERWQKGLTGYPIVDAGMRELWQTGYMHNRVRMIVGSFLVKNLMIHWRHGEQWFWDCLVDADLASNCFGWQWIAGTGADAAPYFRIFNPVTQGKKFDPSGEYTRKFLPELAELPVKHLFDPWNAPGPVLKNSGVVLGETYPMPIVPLKESRERALMAFKSLS